MPDPLSQISSTVALELSIDAALASLQREKRPNATSFEIGYEENHAARLVLATDPVFQDLIGAERRGRRPTLPGAFGRADSYDRSRTVALSRVIKGDDYRSLEAASRSPALRREQLAPRPADQAWARAGVVFRREGYRRRGSYKRGGSRRVVSYSIKALDSLLRHPKVGPVVNHFRDLLAPLADASGIIHSNTPAAPRTEAQRLLSRRSRYKRRLLQLKNATKNYANAMRNALMGAIEDAIERDAKVLGRAAVVVTTERILRDGEPDEILGWWQMVKRGEAKPIYSRLAHRVATAVPGVAGFVLNPRCFNAFLRPEAEEIRQTLWPGLRWRPS